MKIKPSLLKRLMSHVYAIRNKALGEYYRSLRTIIVLSILCILIVGCSTQSAYQSISATETAVLASNAAYLDSVVSGATGTNSVPTVEAAFNDTQMALHAAAAIASGGSSAPVPAATATKAQSFTNMVNSVIGKK